MPTQRKIDQVKDLEDKLKKSTIVIGTEFRGVTVADMSAFRKKLRENKIDYMVVKSTLAARAGDAAGKPNVREVLKGPTAIAFGYGEVVDPAKVITEHIRASKIGITVTGAVLDGQVLAPADVQRLSTVPPRPVLISQLMGNMKGPIAGLVYGLKFHVGGLTRVLDGLRKQLENAAAQAVAPAPAPPAAPPAPAATAPPPATASPPGPLSISNGEGVVATEGEALGAPEAPRPG